MKIIGIFLILAWPLFAEETFILQSKDWQLNGETYSALTVKTPLRISSPVKNGKYYKISFESFGKNGEYGNCRISINSRNSKFEFRLFNSWSRCEHIIYPDAEGKIDIRIFPPSQPFQIRQITVSELSEKDLNANLISDGDAEDVTCHGGDFIHNKRTPYEPMSVTDNPGHFAGNKSYLFQVKQAEKGMQGCVSRGLPIIPGETYKLSFWAKSDTAIMLTVGISLFAPFGHDGKYFSVSDIEKIFPEWDYHEILFTIPADRHLYPDLDSRLVKFFLRIQRSKEVRIWFDDFSLQKQNDPAAFEQNKP